MVHFVLVFVLLICVFMLHCSKDIRNSGSKLMYVFKLNTCLWYIMFLIDTVRATNGIFTINTVHLWSRHFASVMITDERAEISDTQNSNVNVSKFTVTIKSCISKKKLNTVKDSVYKFKFTELWCWPVSYSLRFFAKNTANMFYL